MYGLTKRRLEIKNQITDLSISKSKKQTKIQKVTNKISIITNKLDMLAKEEKLLSHIENDPLMNSLSTLLILPIIEICQSFNTYKICECCDNYHKMGFCPKECLSTIRNYEMKYKFNSTLIACDKNQSQKKTIPIIFYDENDNELWKWVIEKEYPDRAYKLKMHNCEDDYKITSATDYLEMQVLMMRTTDKPPRIRKTPPLIYFNWKGKNHIYFETIFKKK